MTAMVMTFLIVCGAVLQAVVPTGAALGQVRIPVLIGLVVYYSLTKKRKTALVAAVLAGLLQDALCMIPLGFSSFSFILIAWFISNIRDEVFTRHWLTHLLLGIVVVPANMIVLFLLLSQAGLLAVPVSSLLLKLWGSVVIGALFVPIIFKATEGLEMRLGLMEGREV